MFGLFKKKDRTVTDSSDDKAKSAERDTITPIPREKPSDHVSAPVMDEFVPPPGMSADGSGIPSGIPGFDYNPVDIDEEFKANGGKPLAEGATPASKDDVLAALQTVYDPEIPVNIYDLGLIYTCEIGDNGNVDIEMTLTAPGCPVAGTMPGMVVEAVEKVENVGEIEVKLVWEPGWHPGLMSEDAKIALAMG